MSTNFSEDLLPLERRKLIMKLVDAMRLEIPDSNIYSALKLIEEDSEVQNLLTKYEKQMGGNNES